DVGAGEPRHQIEQMDADIVEDAAALRRVFAPWHALIHRRRALQRQGAHRADRTGAEDLGDTPQAALEPQVQAEPQHHPGLPAGAHSGLAAGEVESQRLFAQHMLSRRRRGKHDRHVLGIRGRDINRVDPVIAHERPDILVGPRNSVFRGEFGRLFRIAGGAAGDHGARRAPRRRDHSLGGEFAEPDEPPADRLAGFGRIGQCCSPALVLEAEISRPARPPSIAALRVEGEAKMTTATSGPGILGPRLIRHAARVALLIAAAALCLLAAGPLGWRVGWWSYSLGLGTLLPWSFFWGCGGALLGLIVIA